MNTVESDIEKMNGAAKARLEKIRGLSLVRDESAPTRSRRLSRVVVVLLCVLVLQTLAFAYFMIFHSGSQSDTAAAVPAAAAGVVSGEATEATGGAPVSAADAGLRLQAQGFIIPMRQATVSTRVAGIVTEVPVDVGDFVERGQVVGVLNSDLAGQDLQRAEKELSSLRSFVARERARQEQADSEYQRELLLEQGNYTTHARVDEKLPRLAVCLTSPARHRAGIGFVRLGTKHDARRLPWCDRWNGRFIYPGADPDFIERDDFHQRSARHQDVPGLTIPADDEPIVRAANAREGQLLLAV